MTDVTLQAGAALGNYRIERLLGKGGMGEVYVARHILLDKPVALKVLNRAMVTDEALVQRFLREGRAAARVRHDHVIEVFDVGVADGVPFLAMELLDGQPLDARFKQGPLDATEIVGLLLPVAAAVATAHQQGVVHRDLKPDNVFLRRDSRGHLHPVVLDFGISKIVENESLHLTDTRAMMGTPFYMSPEQARGAKTVTGATDQYALGVILYEGMTGQRPFQADSLLELVFKISTGEYVRPEKLVPALPSGLGAVVARAMAKEAKDRFDSVWAMGEALLPFARPADREQWGRVFSNRRTGAMADTAIAGPSQNQPAAPTTLRGSVREVEALTRPRRRYRLAALAALPLIAGIVWFAMRPATAPLIGPTPKPPEPEPATRLDAAVATTTPTTIDAGVLEVGSISAGPEAGSKQNHKNSSNKKHGRAPVLRAEDF